MEVAVKYFLISYLGRNYNMQRKKGEDRVMLESYRQTTAHSYTPHPHQTGPDLQVVRAELVINIIVSHFFIWKRIMYYETEWHGQSRIGSSNVVRREKRG